MKRFDVLSAVMLVIVAVFAMAATRNVTGLGAAVSYVSGSATYGQTDTVKWYREKNVSSLSFAAKYSDTVNVITARVLRVVNGKPIAQGAAQYGDTLPNLTALIDSTPANATAGIVKTDRILLEGLARGAVTSLDTVGLRPLADEYWVIVQYDSLPTGTFGSQTVRYEFIKGYE